MEDYSIVFVVIGILSIVMVICTFVMFRNIARIRKCVCSDKDYFKLFWLHKNLGDYDKAYEYLRLHYLLKQYEAHYYLEEDPTEDYQNYIASLCKEIDRPAPDFKTFGVKK